MTVASLLGQGVFALSRVTLTQFDAPLFGCPNEAAAHLVIKPCVRWKSNRLLLNGGVDIDVVEMMLLDQFLSLRSLDGFLQQLLCTLRADAVAPANQGGRIQREFVLEIFETTEVLPVGVFQETFHHRLITFVESVLQVVKAHDQPDWKTGTPDTFHKERTERVFEVLPVHLIGQHKEGMFGIENLIQTGFEKIALA